MASNTLVLNLLAFLKLLQFIIQRLKIDWLIASVRHLPNVASD